MAGMKGVALHRHLGAPGARRVHNTARRWVLVALVAVLLGVTVIPVAPAFAFPKTAPTMRIILTKQFFGAQFLSISADDLSHPERATFTITSYSELWYKMLEYPSDPSLAPVAANPPNDLLSQALAGVDLMAPTGIFPLNSDFTTLERIHLQVHFTKPGQQLQIVFNPFDIEPAGLDVIHLLLLLAGDEDASAELGLLKSGTIKEVLDQIQKASDFVHLVNDFTSMLSAAVHGDWLGTLGAAHAYMSDLIHLASIPAELIQLGSIFALTVGQSVARKDLSNLLKVVARVLSILDGAKYLADLVMSFGNYLIYNSNYPTITLSSVASVTPAPGSAGARNVVVYPVPGGTPGDITAGLDGNLWFDVAGAAGSEIDRITSDGVITRFPLPPTDNNLGVFGLTAGPDGALWFVVVDRACPCSPSPPVGLGRMTYRGVVTIFPVNAGSYPTALAVGPDGNIWFTSRYTGLGRITPDGHSTMFPVDAAGSGGIAVGADGNLWFGALSGAVGQIGRITPSGEVTLFPIPADAGTDACPDVYACGLASGPDGNLWLADEVDGTVVRITTSGHMTKFPIPTSPWTIASGPDSKLWFWGPMGVGHITPEGAAATLVPALQGYEVSGMAVLPGNSALWLAGVPSSSDEGVILRYTP